MGGSAITMKSKLETLNAPALDATALQIAAAAQAGVKLAVLHGAGSFGHFQAKQYLISKGNAHPEWAFGFADTRRAVTKLNHEVGGRKHLLNES
jgi:isopentenyl phosphate kinase